MTLQLISHTLFSYVQRAVISLTEKGVAFEQTNIDLAHKPDWFLTISPLGKTPVLLVDNVPIFESAVILEYLEDTQPGPLHPQDPLDRARHRAWMEFGSAVLNDIAGFYSASDEESFDKGRSRPCVTSLCGLKGQLGKGPYFAGERFTLVDVVFGPVFRYFDTFDLIRDFGIFSGLSRVRMWRGTLARRASIASAVTSDYPDLLERFIQRKGSRLSTLLAQRLSEPTMAP